MIIIRYLVWETLKNQIAILFILLSIFFCQKLVRILGATVEGDIPINIVLTILGLSIPLMAQLILPLSLFLAILITFGRLYADSEIIVMHACGLGKNVLIRSSMILILLTILLAILNSGWVGPWSARYQHKIIQHARENLSVTALMAGKFHKSPDGNTVLFIEHINKYMFNNVFLTQSHKERNTQPYIIIAERGCIDKRNDGAQIVTLDTGFRFEGNPLLHNFRITNFKTYKAIIHPPTITRDFNNAEQMNFPALWAINAHIPNYRSELHWRLTLVFSILVMGLIVIPLSIINPRHGRVLSMLPAMLLYLIFFLLQSLMQSSGRKGQINPAISMWIINFTYLGLAILLNLWDTPLFLQLREWCIRRGKV
ncbi:Lipopolysaccharide export system permease protein LptF [Candidatus Erwinia haradaeae]|uniref:Lipopolysaccharide export system permease protein LptF n=1 Tax=Candidatus Erwinia haradaeae TaxID=1922217 RepID=A0A451DDH4_9GAMM|nr:LPS export ABC transporter permease LptF [Candidatus Erwinia haradaeae]VFP84500.1 Lipopolysaccharide export system permease protein LptF [Candidatus Erwinia haradaeae]